MFVTWTPLGFYGLYMESTGILWSLHGVYMDPWGSVRYSLNGLPGSSGHSFRIGGTTELLISGVPPDVVKMMG